MPTASVGRLEKQASIDACEPLRQGITMIEHKIRNLEKRKARLDSCRDLQKSGKDLNSDQVEAISKYDAVIQHLDFARELSKQLTALANDSTKTLKKQARKEAAEKAQQDFNRTKEILIIQDVLMNMGTDAIREDFLQGKGKVTMTQEELQSIDDLYVELTPKKEEPRAFVDMFQTPAETMVALIEGKNKEAFGTTYSALKAKLLEVATSGYFDTLAPAPLTEEPQPPVVETVPTELPTAEKMPEMIPVEQIEEMNLRQLNEQTPVQNVQTCSFQATGAKPTPLPPVMTPQDQFSYAQQVQPEVIPGAPSIETTYFTPSHLRVFKSGTIDFMQENELDTPESGEQPSSIPTMTYTNQNYGGAPMVDHHPVVQPPPAEVQQYQNQQTDEEKGWKTVTSNSIETTVIEATSSPAVQNTNAWANNSTLVMDQPQNRQRQNSNSGGAGGEDWASQTEHWQQSQQNTNDGFIPAGGNRGRGGRGRGGGGGDRNNKGNFQKGGRGGSNQSGRGGFNREGGFRGDRGEGGGGYRDRGEGYNRESGGYRNDGGYFNKDQNAGGGGGYQNGYQSGGRGGGARSNRSNQSTDRPGGRGGNRGGRGGGSYRGGNPSGNYRQQQVQ